MISLLQQGISIDSGVRPLPCYRLVLLNIRQATPPAAASDALAAVWEMLSALADGHVRDLGGQPEIHGAATAEQFSGLRFLVGYGRRLFDPLIHDPPLTLATRPEFVSYLPTSPAAFPSIPWAEPKSQNSGEADIAIQLTGWHESSVNCAAVEVWKLTTDERLPFDLVSSFGGFGRQDGRGWLDFHDGVSNIESSQRLLALEARAEPRWMAGGTYMAFLRLAIDLSAWRELERREQELIVGRAKLSGAALVAVERDEGGLPTPVTDGDPATSSREEVLADWRDPPQTVDPLLESSHIHRANQNRSSPAAAGGLRMFRQGYDFFEGFDGGRPIVGLNFVSFQRDLSSLTHVLHLPGWLGDANFGGPARTQEGGLASPALVKLLDGGFYAVPPVAERFPGAGLFCPTAARQLTCKAAAEAHDRSA